ncbi:MAG TPA: hypothetical protein VHB73_02560, partial [Alphaproteobacteria bacterium]|nr:hypothetical protein [Alphaproteobacteria bacterium]
MTQRRPVFLNVAGAVLAGLVLMQPALLEARSASFLDPSSASGPAKGDGKGGGGPTGNTLTADPVQTDAGETLVNVARRITVFFYNGFRMPVKLNELTINADGNVRSKVLTDDCKAVKNLPPQDRCSIILEVVPSSPGPWSVELLLNHSGPGRLVRAEVVGTTLGKTDDKSEGLAVSKKIAAPLDFGEVRSREDSASRTMLIENDSTEPLKISSIDLIRSDQSGLSLRKGGCKEGDDLKPGESCPITIIWEPTSRGALATDLIVHHSGSLGFVVVPVRGVSSGGSNKGDDSKSAKDSGDMDSGGAVSTTTLLPAIGGQTHAMLPSSFSPPPTPDQIARTLPSISSKKLDKSARPAEKEDKEAKEESSGAVTISLIGTVNGKAILGSDDNQTYLLGLGDTTMIGEHPVSLLQLDTSRAVVSVSGTRKELFLRQGGSVVQSKKTSQPNF